MRSTAAERETQNDRESSPRESYRQSLWDAN